MEEPKLSNTNQSEIVCVNCAAKLKFAPGTTHLKCEYCGAENEIFIDQEALKDATQEIDFLSFINSQVQTAPMQDVLTVKCNSCGASTTFDKNVISSKCDFCDSPMVAKQGETHNIIKPKSLLPFKIEEKKSLEMFKTWIKKLWWAPNNLKKQAKQTGKINGVYIPYWTYDARTHTNYRGERGDDYQVREAYQKDGRTEYRTVTKTRWSGVSGRVNNVFDDVLVVGSKSLPVKYMDKLEPWNFNELVPYEDKFLTGFKTETYQVDVKQGFEVAKQKMDPIIDQTIRRDIGGDHQRINSKSTQYNNITFKHILLPIWISAYRYNNKVYRFMVNGQTGEVQGERPYSWIKITLAILFVLAIIAVIIYFANQS
jgi:LSD1 subclass zinc finger protein